MKNRSTITLFTCLVLLLISFLNASCGKDSYLTRDDRKTLFAPPTTEEIDAVLVSWQTKDLLPGEYQVIEEHQTGDGKFTFKIVGYRLAGIKQYGALLIPNDGAAMPLRFLVGGFGYNVRMNSVKLVADASTNSKPSIMAIPALRGQSLSVTINGATYTSPQSEGNHCDAFDGATDDVIGFLNLIAQTESRADVQNTSVRGGSRGGTVALLAGIRDKRVKKVVGIAGPVNMLSLTADNENDETYQCQFLDGLKNKTADISQVRKKLIASSPAYFVKHLPQTQVHMGILDKNVPIAQASELENAAKAAGNTASVSVFTYNRSHTDIAVDNKELDARLAEFLAW